MLKCLILIIYDHLILGTPKLDQWHNGNIGKIPGDISIGKWKPLCINQNLFLTIFLEGRASIYWDILALWPTTFTLFGWVVFHSSSYGRSAIHGATALRRPQSQAAGLALGMQMLDLQYFNMCKHLGYTCAHTVYILYIYIIYILYIYYISVYYYCYYSHCCYYDYDYYCHHYCYIISKWHCRLVSQSSLPSWVEASTGPVDFEVISPPHRGQYGW